MALLKLPRLYLLAFPVGPEFDSNTSRAQEGRWPARWMLLGAEFISFNLPRLCELIHVKLELAVASHGVVALVAIVVPTKTAETATQVWGRYNFYKTVTVPRDLQTW